MDVIRLGLRGLALLRPQHHRDPRGWFTETFSTAAFTEAGLPTEFAQDNNSFSRHGVLRGLHLQSRQPQGKLVRVLRGEIWDVAVDLRRDSPSFGRWTAVELREPTPEGDVEMLWIPEGFAHGFLVLSEAAEVAYKVTRPYDPGGEQTVLWNDTELAIDWPLERIAGRSPILSAKDAAGLPLNELAQVTSAR